MRFDMLDYPTAWEIQRERCLVHKDERCSAMQTDGAMLCDCGAIEDEWERLRVAAGMRTTQKPAEGLTAARRDHASPPPRESPSPTPPEA